MKQFLKWVVPALLLIAAFTAYLRSPFRISRDAQTALAQNPPAAWDTRLTVQLTAKQGEETRRYILTADGRGDFDGNAVHSLVNITVSGESAARFTLEHSLWEQNGTRIGTLSADGLLCRSELPQLTRFVSAGECPIGAPLWNRNLENAKVTRPNGRTVLSGTVPDSQCRQAASDWLLPLMALLTRQGALVEPTALPWDSLTASTIITLENTTMFPLTQETIYQGIAPLLSPLWEELFPGSTLTDGEATLAVTCRAFGESGSFPLPYDFAPDVPAESYSLREGDALVTVTPPEGYLVTDSAYDTLTCTEDGLGVFLQYRLWDFSGSSLSPDEFFAETAQSLQWSFAQTGAAQCETKHLGKNTRRAVVTAAGTDGSERRCTLLWRPMDSAGNHWLLLTAKENRPEQSSLSTQELLSLLDDAKIADSEEPPACTLPEALKQFSP